MNWHTSAAYRVPRHWHGGYVYGRGTASLDEEAAAEAVDWLLELVREELSWSKKLGYKITAMNLSVSLQFALEEAAMLHVPHDAGPMPRKMLCLGIPVNWVEQPEGKPMVSFLRKNLEQGPAGGFRD